LIVAILSGLAHPDSKQTAKDSAAKKQVLFIAGTHSTPTLHF
jgi:hypothetical protein